MATGILAERLQKRLRAELGLVYATGLEWQPLSRDKVFIVHGTDCEPSAAVEVSRVFVEEVRRLIEDGPTEEERLFALENATEDEVDLASFRRTDAHRLAYDELVGDQIIRNEDVVDQRKPFGLAEIQQAAARIVESAYIVLADVPDLGIDALSLSSDAAVRGKSYRAVGSEAGGYRRAVVGDEGFTMVTTDETITMQYGDIAGVEFVSPTLRWVIGFDGRSVRVDGSEWWRGKKLLAALDARFPADRRIPGPLPST